MSCFLRLKASNQWSLTPSSVRVAWRNAFTHNRYIEQKKTMLHSTKRNKNDKTLLDSSAKLMGRLLLNSLESLALENNLSRSQYGFQKRKGTIDQCLNLNLLIAKYTAGKGAQLYMAFMDLSAAFDLHTKL